MKKKLEFSKKMVIAAYVVVILCILSSVTLSFFDKEPLSDITMAVITCFGGFVTSGYFLLSGSRDNSKNKYGITQYEYKYQNNNQEDGDTLG